MSFIRAGVIYAVANVTSSAVPFLLLPLLTRALNPTEYGRVVSFALLVTLCRAFAGLNAQAALGVVWFQKPRDQMPAFTATALVIAIGSTLVTAPVVAFVLHLFPHLGSGIAPAWGAVAALTAGSTVILQCRLVLWQSQHLPIHNAILQFLASVLDIGLSLIAVLAFNLGSNGRNGGIAVAACLMACVAIAGFFRSRELRWPPEAEHVRTLVIFGLPLVLHTLAGITLATADRWIVSSYFGPHSLGVYGAGAQLGMVMAVVSDAFVKAYGPWQYANLTSTDADAKHRAVGAIYAALPAFVGAASLIGVVLYWAAGALLGPQYGAAAGIIPWFMVGGAFTGVYVSTSVLFFFAGRTAVLASVTSSAAVIGAVLTWTLASRLGVHGAAIGYALTQGLLAALTMGVALWLFELPWREVGKSLTIWSRYALGSAQKQHA